MRSLVVAVVMTAGFLSACQSSKPAPNPAQPNNSASVRLLQAINKNAQTCWVKSKDRVFRAYKIIPELDTRVGKPRILVVKARAAQGLPQMVIEAQGTPPNLSSYGPLGDTALGTRMNADIGRWAGGESGCNSA